MPRTCIGIQIYQQPERLFATIGSLRANTGFDAQIILLPDGLDAATHQALSSLPDLTHLPTADAVGAAACFNRLASYCGRRRDHSSGERRASRPAVAGTSVERARRRCCKRSRRSIN